MRMTIGMLRQIIKEEVSAFRDFESPTPRRQLREMSEADRKLVRDVMSNANLNANPYALQDNLDGLYKLKQNLKDINNMIPSDPKDEHRSHWNNTMKKLDLLIGDLEDYKVKNPTYPEPYSYK